MRRGLVVVEAGLVRGRLRVAAAGRDAARGTEAAGVTVALCVGQRQGHNGVDTPLDDLVLGAALLHFVLGVMAVGCDLNSRAFKGRGNIGSQAMGQVIARRCVVFVLQAIACLVARCHRYDWAGLQGVVLGGQTGVAHSQRQADVWGVAVRFWKDKIKRKKVFKTRDERHENSAETINPPTTA